MGATRVLTLNFRKQNLEATTSKDSSLIAFSCLIYVIYLAILLKSFKLKIEPTV